MFHSKLVEKNDECAFSELWANGINNIFHFFHFGWCEATQSATAFCIRNEKSVHRNEHGARIGKSFISFFAVANFNIDWQIERADAKECANWTVWINKCKFEIVSEIVIAGSEQLLQQLSLLNLRTRSQTIRMNFCMNFAAGSVFPTFADRNWWSSAAVGGGGGSDGKGKGSQPFYDHFFARQSFVFCTLHRKRSGRKLPEHCNICSIWEGGGELKNAK